MTAEDTTGVDRIILPTDVFVIFVTVVSRVGDNDDNVTDFNGGNDSYDGDAESEKRLVITQIKKKLKIDMKKWQHRLRE